MVVANAKKIYGVFEEYTGGGHLVLEIQEGHSRMEFET